MRSLFFFPLPDNDAGDNDKPTPPSQIITITTTQTTTKQPTNTTAYYLKYQNRRPEYIAAWWGVVSWEQASANFEGAKKGELPKL